MWLFFGDKKKKEYRKLNDNKPVFLKCSIYCESKNKYYWDEGYMVKHFDAFMSNEFVNTPISIVEFNKKIYIKYKSKNNLLIKVENRKEMISSILRAKSDECGATVIAKKLLDIFNNNSHVKKFIIHKLIQSNNISAALEIDPEYTMRFKVK